MSDHHDDVDRTDDDRDDLPEPSVLRERIPVIIISVLLIVIVVLVIRELSDNATIGAPVQLLGAATSGNQTA
ncbi:hypothetical protein [Nocardioides bruguierae]|uniref:hypothetical protein n=1 Tax=Nocardioides bruguierae TaxID=2945102 RepID=UPI00202136EE|nr:hypothetical protein [Nocardioides bruguierae]MCL8026354.1 hypothetical protein [Nocardioides bruguierae]